MKFSYLHKVFSVTLSFLVLFSTLSLTIEKHFCGDVLVDVAVFTETEKCADDLTEIDDTRIAKKNCCKDETHVIEGLSQLTTNECENLRDLQKQVFVAYAYSYINTLEGLPNLVIPNKDYSPLIRIKDIQLLDETYLI